jgi:hypothetical protein
LAGDARRLVPVIVEAFRRNGLINFAASISLLLVLAMGASVIGAVVVVRFVPLATGEVEGVAAVISFLGRWLLAGTLPGAAVALMVHHGGHPARRCPVSRWAPSS